MAPARPDLRRYAGVLFDVDGVLTPTAALHAQAWKQMFDGFLADHHPTQSPFDLIEDYRQHVDGRPRAEGVSTFLASRSIDPVAELVAELGEVKNRIVLALIRRGVKPYRGSVRLVESLARAGVPMAVVSSSRNAAEVVAGTGLADYFKARVDGLVAEELGLAGKPAPDTYLEAALRLGVRPADTAVVEDALSGVRSGCAGGFGLVVGVDRQGQASALLEAGADLVVSDLGELVP